MQKKPFFSRKQAGRIIGIFLALGLVAFLLSPLQAQEKENIQTEDKSKAQLMQMVEQYEKQGFSRLGPLHVTGLPGDGVVDFYKHGPVRYEEIRIVNERAEEADLDKYDRVYLLQKDGQVILIRLNQEEHSNV